jgi:hypothetical protein
LISNSFRALLKEWAFPQERRQIKHLAALPPAFPQSYPQLSGTVSKVVPNHQLNWHL